MPNRNFEPMTKSEVVAAQDAWAKCVTEQDVDGLLELYDFGDPDAPVLFKPTLANVIRLDEKGAKAYFVGGDPDYPGDNGFLKNAWKAVEFKSASGPVQNAGGLAFQDMGQYAFVNGAGEATHADYTFAYHKREGRVLISLHHSSLTWFPSSDA
ncbi:MAG: phosphoribosyl-AMP cyclohydrolase [Pseudomonadota bacterium]